MLTVGSSLPAFSLLDDAGNEVTEASFIGKWSILYFYPKDDTTGCTAEACSIRDAKQDFAKHDIEVIGVSPDSVKSHVKFKTKYDLNFTLLADTEHKLCEAMGVWAEKSMYGRKYMGVERSTFVIDPKGKIAAAYPKVNPVDHGLFLLKEVKALVS